MIKFISYSTLLIASNAIVLPHLYAQQCVRCYSVDGCGPINPGYQNCKIGKDYQGVRRCVNGTGDCHSNPYGKNDSKKESVDQLASKPCQSNSSAA